MKRVGYIWERFCSVENATVAIYRGTENKRDDRAVRRIFGYEDNLSSHSGQLNPQKVEKYARNLVEELDGGNWHHLPGKKQVIQSSGKTRNIEIARLRDHIVQWMAILAVEDTLLKKMYRYSCGNVPKRGIEDARKAVQRWVRSGDCKYFVKLDIRHFYQNVEAEKLSRMMHGMFKDKRYLEIIDQLIYSAAEPDEHGVYRGLAIGYYSSPWFANIYLTLLDRFVTEQLYKTRRGKRVRYVKHYVRNVDDQVLFGTSKSDLEKAVKAITSYCRDTLGVEIKPCWEISRIGELLPADGGKMKLKPGTRKVDIVGYTFTTTTTTVRDYGFLRCKRLAKRISKRLKEKGEVILHNAQSFMSRCGWFSHSDSKYFFKTYINPIVDINFIKEVISYADKNGISGTSSRIYCCPRGNGCGYRILYARRGRTA